MKPDPRLVILVPALAAGCGQPNEFAPPPPPTVTVVRPLERDVTAYAEFTGRTEALEQVEIRARVKGFLETIEFSPGALVETGDRLFTIDRRPFEAAVASARADLEQREADLGLSETNLKLVRKVAEEGAASVIEQERAQAERGAAAARVAAAEAAVEQAQIDLDYTSIAAPLSGRISRNFVDEGNLVGASEPTLLATIVDDDPIYAYFTIDERTLLRYLDEGRPEQKPESGRRILHLQFSDGRDYEHPGRADMVDTTVDPATGTLQVRTIFPNPDGKLLPGFFVRVRVPSPVEDAVLVPEIALQRDLAGEYALVVNAEGVVERRDVERGQMAEGMRIITAGLTADDRVIVNGIQRARVGIAVHAVEGEEERQAGEPGEPGTGAAESSGVEAVGKTG